MTKESNSKLADFGVSKIIDQDTQNSLTFGVGSFSYMSAEIKQGNNYDYKTDIWCVWKRIIKIFTLLFLLCYYLQRSAGCVVYELIALKKFTDVEENTTKLDFEIPIRLVKLMKL